MAEMRRSTRSDPHPPKTLDLADSLQSNPSVQAPMGRQRVAAAAAAAATTTTTSRGTVSDADDDGIAPLDAFDAAAGKALDDEDGMLEIDDGDRTFGHNEIMGFESDGGGSDDDDVSEGHGVSMRTMAKMRRSTRPVVRFRYLPKAFDSPDLLQDGPPVAAAPMMAMVPSTSMSRGILLMMGLHIPSSDDGDEGNALLDAVDPAGKVVDDGNAILQLDVGDSVFGRDEDIGSERDGSSDDEDGGNASLDATSGVPPIRDVGFPRFATEYSASTDSRGAPASGGGCGNDDDDAVPENDVARFDDNVDGNALLGVDEDCKDGADVETEANDDDAAADDNDDDGGPSAYSSSEYDEFRGGAAELPNPAL
ncbi:hypothetical protein BJ912DRAFT_1063055 [Pholiota molesta]|nr:hypothetical protein BJ912DRAFT_1063055 [Pholiota molesta]